MFSSFKPEHINANHEDFMGNKGRGRYILFPGSDGRAKQIAEQTFNNLSVKESPRRHNLYLGTIGEGSQKIDVASISSGMGTPSLDIIFNELVRLGAKRFLRIGTAGLMQPQFMKGGDFAVATGAVRDEGATRNYVPPEYPAIASIDMVIAAQIAAKKLGCENKTHFGLMHSKDSLYAREFEEGPMVKKNKEYMDILRNAGVVASEMEASMLFVLAALFNHKLNPKGVKSDVDRIKAGAICLILGEKDDFGDAETIKRNTIELTKLSSQMLIELAKIDGVI